LDLRNQAAVQQFFDREHPEYVFLAAAHVGGIMANSTYKAQFIYDNLAIAMNVIHSSHSSGVRKLLNLGSSCIYPRLAPQPLKEEYLLGGPLEQTNEPYAIAKIAAIKLCRFYNEQYRTNYLSAMPTNLYGPNDNFNLETAHVLPALIRKFSLARMLREESWDAIGNDLRRTPLGFGIAPVAGGTDRKLVESQLRSLGISRESVTLWGTGTPYREFLHVDDLATAAFHLMKNYSYQDVGELVNVGLGVDETIADIALLVKDIVGFSGAIQYDATKPDGTPRKVLDVTRMHQFGWKAQYTLEAGVRQTIAWYRALK
jgi:GDP-L-fucose synthase